LRQLELKFEVQPSNVDETFDPAMSPDKIAQQLAHRKAESVAKKQQRKAVVIGSDTLVLFENHILEKPADEQEAIQMLEMLNDQTHVVLTGVALCKVNSSGTIMDTTSFVESTNVTFSKMNPKVIRYYVSHAKPFDKAGSYGIQDQLSALFVKQIDGDYNNVVGFPLHAFFKALQNFAPEYLPPKWVD
jgi:septum formation protein